MSRGPWQIAGEKRRFSCFAKLCHAARVEARRRGHPVRVRYLGPRQKPNRDITRSDFMMHAGGHRDASVDPTWYRRKKR